MQKKLMYLEIAGILFIVIMSVFMQNLLDLSGHTLIGVMFGSVNDSIWEIEKTLLFPYLLWAGIELLCIKIPFRKGGFPLVFLPFIFGNLPAVFSYRCANPLSARIYRRTHLLYFSFFHIFPLDGRQQKV
mgnify:CR=1 FL=1